MSGHTAGIWLNINLAALALILLYSFAVFLLSGLVVDSLQDRVPPEPYEWLISIVGVLFFGALLHHAIVTGL